MILAARAFAKWRFGALMLCLASVLAGCAAIALVPAYDEQIDSGLTSLYADTGTFVDRMIGASGTPAGEYAQNMSFYDEVDGRVEALIVRAEAHRALNDCPASKAMNAALAAAHLPASVRDQIGALPADDCQAVLMKLIKGGFRDMRAFHKVQGARGIPPPARCVLMDGGVGALLRAAITVEIAKRGR